MKKVFLITAAIMVIPLAAGPNHSKQKKSEPQDVSEELLQSSSSSSKPIPFGGKHWKKVYISQPESSVHDVYTFDGSVIKKWDFGGYESTEIGSTNQPNSYAYFTDDTCYLIKDTEMTQFCMHSGAAQKIEMRNPITAISANQLGAIVKTSDGHTLFDPAGEVQDFYPLKKNEYAFLNRTPTFLNRTPSGELFKVKRSTVRLLAAKTEKWKEFHLKDTPETIEVINGHVTGISPHPSIKNGAIIQFINVETGETDSYFSVTPYPEQRSFDGAHLAIVGGGENPWRTIKVYDLQTSQQVYDGRSDDICGCCALCLEGPNIYFVGDSPTPKSQIIDTRQKSK